MTAQRRAPSFVELFGRPPEVSARAPGRVNLIGEHTDYNGGYVLPMVIPQETRVELARRPDAVVRAFSADIGAAGEQATYRLGEEARRGEWIDYVQGVTAVLARSFAPVSGFDVRIDSDVPVGSGLSSSAALSVALLRGLREAFGLSLDGVRIAQLGQRTETDFVGAPVGIMDPMVCSLGTPGTALFIDTRDLEHETIPFPEGAGLAVIASGISHSHADGEYRVRRYECERAAELLGVVQLRDLGPADLPRVAGLPAPLDRRARHVITEDARVLAAVAAMRAAELSNLGELFKQSHASLRDDYEVSVPEIDLLVDLANAEPSVLGARITGGGFGGCVVLLTRQGEEPAVAERVARTYRERTGKSGQVLVPEPPSGP